MVPRNGKPAQVARVERLNPKLPACPGPISCAPLHVWGGARVALMRVQSSQKHVLALGSGLCHAEVLDAATASE